MDIHLRLLAVQAAWVPALTLARPAPPGLHLKTSQCSEAPGSTCIPTWAVSALPSMLGSSLKHGFFVAQAGTPWLDMLCRRQGAALEGHCFSILCACVDADITWAQPQHCLVNARHTRAENARLVDCQLGAGGAPVVPAGAPVVHPSAAGRPVVPAWLCNERAHGQSSLL